MWELIKARLAAIPPERFVTFITPIVTPVVGIASAWLLRHFPDMPYFGQTQLLIFGTAAAASAWSALQHWLKGSREYQHDLRRAKVDKATRDHKDPVAALEEPSDIAESDADPPDHPERRERIVENE